MNSQWKNTILAGLANYIDAGSIVASRWAPTSRLRGR
jgi:hypothetical protein